MQIPLVADILWCTLVYLSGGRSALLDSAAAAAEVVAVAEAGLDLPAAQASPGPAVGVKNNPCRKSEKEEAEQDVGYLHNSKNVAL